jgi:teichuronic acid biosynthesis glycosyltransferase TuaG
VYKIAICLPSLGSPTLKTWNAFNNLVKPRSNGELPGETHFITIEDRPVDDARQWLTRQALSVEGLTHILWIDDDMEFPPHALKQLLSHDKPIVGGLCHNRRSPAYQPIVAKKYHPDLAMPQDALGFVYDLPQSGLYECDATGAAFLLVRADVFKAITERFGPDSWWVPAGNASEDFSFCARARECGYSVFVDCGLDIGHIGTATITRDTASKLRTLQMAKWVPKVDAPAGKPLVSVIIPTYNQRPMYLKAAVLSALNQTVPTEVIVVDDGTTDYCIRTPDEAAQGIGGPSDRSKPERMRKEDFSITLPPQVKLIRHDTNRGISAALNTGIAHMTTDYFCWLSSDDTFHPEKVQKQLNAMLASGAKASFTDYTVIDNTPETFGKYVVGPTWRTIEEQTAMLRYVCCINGSTVMLHASVFEAFAQDSMKGRFFDLDLKYGQDWDAWCKIGQKFLWLRIPESLGTRREDGNLTSAIQAAPADDSRRKRRDEEDKIVRERYAIRRFVAIQRGLCVTVMGSACQTFEEADQKYPSADGILEILL